MAIKRWTPSQIVSRQEAFILKRLKRNVKLYAFLRLHRHQLFDDAFQLELEAMYRDTGAGKEPHPPALMAMVLLQLLSDNWISPPTTITSPHSEA